MPSFDLATFPVTVVQSSYDLATFPVTVVTSSFVFATFTVTVVTSSFVFATFTVTVVTSSLDLATFAVTMVMSSFDLATLPVTTATSPVSRATSPVTLATSPVTRATSPVNAARSAFGLHASSFALDRSSCALDGWRSHWKGRAGAGHTGATTGLPTSKPNTSAFDPTLSPSDRDTSAFDPTCRRSTETPRRSQPPFAVAQPPPSPVSRLPSPFRPLSLPCLDSLPSRSVSPSPLPSLVVRSSVLSYAHGPSSTPLIGETIGEHLRRIVERHGDREALVVRSQGYRATYRQLWDATTTLARALIAEGISPGERVAIWSPNRWEWVVTQFATARIGAILVNINPAYKSAELRYALQQSGAQLLLLARGFRTTSYVDMLAEVGPECPQLQHAVVIDDDWGTLCDRADEVDLATLETREAGLQFDDPINIQYTSGTTGFPKGATLSHHNLLNNGFFIGEALRFTPADRVCIPVPFYHCFGMVLGNLACITHGACMVVPGEAFDPTLALETVQAERCTALYGVPSMFIAELALPDFVTFDLSTLRTGIMAGSPCPIEVMKRVQSEMHMTEVTICYGMTETSPVSTQSAVDDPLDRRVSTVGRVHPHVEVKVVDPETSAVLPRGATGELCTRGYSVMRGYWNNPEATAAAIDVAGWMHTGDLATMDDEGYVNIVGRIKDMIIRGGENIYPREIEEYLYTHPAVQDAQVIGVPSERYGEEVMAWIIARPGMTVTADDIVAWCRGRISSYKIPRYVKFVDGYPMTVTGKIQKFRMREMAVGELGLERAAAVATA